MPSRATSFMRFLSVAVLGLLIAACDSRLEESESAEIIFYGGDILTMVGEAP